MAEFHEADWPKRSEIFATFEDSRYQSLGQRLLATEQPVLLSDNQKRRWIEWCRQRLVPEKQVPWRTLDTAIQEAVDLQPTVTEDDRRKLDAIVSYLRKIKRDATKATARQEDPRQERLSI